MPMPAAKSIATHANVLNSAFSPSLPSGILPYGENARMRRETRTTMATRLKNQPTLSVDQSKAPWATEATRAGSEMPQMTKATVSEPATAKITLSIEYRRRRSSMAMPGTRIGWMSCGYWVFGSSVGSAAVAESRLGRA